MTIDRSISNIIGLHQCVLTVIGLCRCAPCMIRAREAFDGRVDEHASSKRRAEECMAPFHVDIAMQVVVSFELERG